MQTFFHTNELPTGGIELPQHMHSKPQLAFTGYGGNRSRISFMERLLIRQKYMQAVPHDPAKESSIKDISSPLQVSVQCFCLTTKG